MDEDVIDYYNFESGEKRESVHKDRKKVETLAHAFKLGEDINNGILYWGQDKIVKSNRTCACICPVCNKVWRAHISSVLSGSTKSCCGRGKKK